MCSIYWISQAYYKIPNSVYVFVSVALFCPGLCSMHQYHPTDTPVFCNNGHLRFVLPILDIKISL